MTNDFTGFPDGELKFTAVPNLFFTKLLPQIDNLAELKVTLHFLWLRQHKKKNAVSREELLTHETLITGLATIAADPFEALTEGLERAVARKTLLHARSAENDAAHDWYFLNSEGGRITLEKMKAGELGVVDVSGADIASPAYARRPNIFELYEANIGLLSPILADELKDAEMTYPPGWIEEAFKIAVENNVRKWSYIRAILEGMATEGKEHGKHQRTIEKDTPKRWYTDEERELFIR